MTAPGVGTTQPPAPPAGQPQGAPPAPPAGEQPGKGETFTQADIDRIVGARIARETAKYVDYEDLKTKAEALDKIKADNASELDKAKEAAKAEGRAEVETTTNARLIKAEAKLQAAAFNFHDPSLVPSLLDLSKVKVDANGDVNPDQLKVLLEDLKVKHPYLVKAEEAPKGPRPPRPSAGQGANPGHTPDDRDAGRAEAEKRFGKKS